jgi:hypothetical protein
MTSVGIILLQSRAPGIEKVCAKLSTRARSLKTTS